MGMNLSDLTASDVPATITVDQAAEILQLSRDSVYEGVKRDQIPSLRVGRRIVLPVPRFLEWLGAKKDSTVVVPDETARVDAQGGKSAVTRTLRSGDDGERSLGKKELLEGDCRGLASHSSLVAEELDGSVPTPF